MGGFWGTFGTVLTGIIGIAVIAVLVSKNSQTPAVFSSFWSGFAQSIGAAVSPVTGSGQSYGVSGLGTTSYGMSS